MLFVVVLVPYSAKKVCRRNAATVPVSLKGSLSLNDIFRIHDGWGINDFGFFVFADGRVASDDDGGRPR